MKDKIGKITIKKIREHNSNLSGLDNSLLVDNETFSYSDVPNHLFEHPLRVDGFIISLREEGEACLNINLRDYKIKKNDLLICTPNDLLQASLSTGNHRSQLLIISSEFINNIFINLNNLIPFFISLRNNPVFHLSDDEISDLKEFFDLIYKSVNNNDKFNEEIVKHLMGSYLYKLGSILQRREVNNKTLNHKKAFNREEVTFNQFINLLTELHCKERRVDYYADRLFLSAKHFSTVVKRVSGKTAGEWIDTYVILEAKALLKYSNMSIQEVSNYLNFPNPSFFGKYFKRHAGMSPSEYKLI